jgi:hypothetical protein
MEEEIERVVEVRKESLEKEDYLCKLESRYDYNFNNSGHSQC